MVVQRLPFHLQGYPSSTYPQASHGVAILCQPWPGVLLLFVFNKAPRSIHIACVHIAVAVASPPSDASPSPAPSAGTTVLPPPGELLQDMRAPWQPWTFCSNIAGLYEIYQNKLGPCSLTVLLSIMSHTIHSCPFDSNSHSMFFAQEASSLLIVIQQLCEYNFTCSLRSIGSSCHLAASRLLFDCNVLDEQDSGD